MISGTRLSDGPVTLCPCSGISFIGKGLRCIIRELSRISVSDSVNALLFLDGADFLVIGVRLETNRGDGQAKSAVGSVIVGG